MDLACLAIWIWLPLIAALVAHRKQRSWGGAAFLTFIAPPIGLLAVLLSGPASHGGGDGDGKASARARYLFGLSPLWLALTVLLIGGATTDSPEYWNVAPWLVVAAIPASIVTRVLVEVFTWLQDLRKGT